MNVRHFYPEDLARIDLQSAQARIRPYLTLEYGAFLANGAAYTMLDGFRVIACGGIVRPPQSRAVLWSLLSSHVHGRLARVHGVARRIIELHGTSDLCATVEAGHVNGCRWLQLLGFRHEESLPGFGPDGSMHELYGRVS
jgi:hypothetical protein